VLGRSQELRFLAKFAKPLTVPDMDRDFTITVYSVADAVAVYEPPKKNSGVLGGQFLAKTRIRNPVTGQFFKWCVAAAVAQNAAILRTRYRTPLAARRNDFAVGSTVVINAFEFSVTGTDPGTEELLVKLRAGEKVGSLAAGALVPPSPKKSLGVAAREAAAAGAGVGAGASVGSAGGGASPVASPTMTAAGAAVIAGVGTRAGAPKV